MSSESTQRRRPPLPRGRWLSGGDLDDIDDDLPFAAEAIGRHRRATRDGDWEPRGKERRRKRRRDADQPGLND
jgi:hypothetical protein